MKSSINVFPKRLTVFSLVFLVFILGFGAYSQYRSFRLLTSFQRNDIPTLQLSCAATRVMSETERLLAGKGGNAEKVSIRALVLDDSLNELVLLTNEFPEVPQQFTSTASYGEFQKYLINKNESLNTASIFSNLQDDVRTMVEEYLFHKNEVIKQQIFFGYISLAISLTGLFLFFFLLFAIYRRYQKNLESLELVTLNLEQERLANIQASKLASLGEMAAGLAHEINNPLTVIVGRVEMILNLLSKGAASDQDVTVTIGKIKDMALRISKIVSSMRKISKGSSSSEIKPTNLSSVMEDILNLSSERMRGSMIELDLTGIDSSLNVMADYSQLTQVLINLFNNGIDELQKNPDDNRRIWVSTESHHDYVVMNIKDSGKGIPIEIRSKLFQPFFTTKDVGKGTGLGLSISKSLMTGMGGDLELDPDLTQTCFILKFKKG